MKTFDINAGTFYSDYPMTDRNFTAEAIGQVTLEDDEVQQLTELIRAHHDETDVEALGLKEHYPAIYQKLEAAYRHTASLAEYKVDMLLGLYLDVWDTPTALIDQCLAELGYDAPNRHFDQLLSHLESLPLEDFAQFMTRHLNQSFEDKPADTYDVEIPQGVIEEA